MPAWPPAGLILQLLGHCPCCGWRLGRGHWVLAGVDAWLAPQLALLSPGWHLGQLLLLCCLCVLRLGVWGAWCCVLCVRRVTFVEAPSAHTRARAMPPFCSAQHSLCMTCGLPCSFASRRSASLCLDCFLARPPGAAPSRTAGTRTQPTCLAHGVACRSAPPCGALPSACCPPSAIPLPSPSPFPRFLPHARTMRLPAPHPALPPLRILASAGVLLLHPVCHCRGS